MTLISSTSEQPVVQSRESLWARVNWEIVLWSAVLILAIVTRFADLGVRVMSHDETQHTYFSWSLYRGTGYAYTPVTHGPLQFHLIAFSYALFGDNDTAARIPHAVAGVLLVAFVWAYRRYIGRTGALIAAFLIVISPFIMYYSRYARNEVFGSLFGLITLWAALRYLEEGQRKHLLLVVLGTALHFLDKATSFIYTAQLLLLLGFFLVWRVSRQSWKLPGLRLPFLAATWTTLGFLGFAIGVGAFNKIEEEVGGALVPFAFIQMAAVIALLAFVIGVWLGLRGFGLQALRQERAFDLMIVLGTLILPLLSAIPINLLGLDPLDYSLAGIFRSAVIIIPVIGLAVYIGLNWNARLWAISAGIFYGLFVVFYTTFFTNPSGFFVGLVGALGYWMEQQAVTRGNQPWYYYLLIQIPMYEYLPFIGSLLAGVLVAWRGIRARLVPAEPAPKPRSVRLDESETIPAPALPAIGFWAISSLVAYTLAGEKMPWLTFHITWAMILLTGWLLGQLWDGLAWREIFNWRGLVAFALLPLFVRALGEGRLLLEKIVIPNALRPVDQFGLVIYGLFALFTALVLLRLLATWTPGQFLRAVLLVGFAVLGFYTARTAYAASFIRYDEATEFLVYAHSAPSNKRILEQLEDLSYRLYGDLSLRVAYDNSDGASDPGAGWPTTWYYRQFPNAKSFGPQPPEDILTYDAILVSDNNWANVEPALRDQYEVFQYIRMWWPIQDYFDLTWERLWGALADPEWRSAIFRIWRDRDYSDFGVLVNRDLSLQYWSPGDPMRLYVRKDIVDRLWDYGSSAQDLPPVIDPYAGGEVTLQASQIIGSQGNEPGMFQRPRNLAVAPDGSLYVADTENHRIQHLAADGGYLGAWGVYDASVEGDTALPGNFNEPWSVAVGPDGSVYVADTWNHRIQKFDSDGELLATWGVSGAGDDPGIFWGPRNVMVDSQGRVFVTDTGNKRIAIYTADGEYLTQIKADFNEPVGAAISPDGRVFVVDTWNRRVVVYAEPQPNIFVQETAWSVDAWYGESLDNKPYIAVTAAGTVVVSDPEGYRLIEFTTQGEFLRTWGSFGSDDSSFALPVGLAAGAQGGVWVADTNNHRLMYFTLE